MALVAAEALVRLFVPDVAGIMVKDAVLGQTYRPLARTTVYDEEAGRRVDIRINSLGFRDREHAAAASPGVRRVLMLGDSFTAGLSVDVERTFPQVCERLLNRNPAGPAWEVITLAVAGYGTAQEMLAYEQYGRRFRPDVVVVNFFSGNDVSDNSRELSNSPRPYFTLVDGRLVGSWPSASRRWAAEWLNEHSRFYTWQKRQTQKIERLVKRTVVVDPVHRVFVVKPDEVMDRAWAVTEALLLDLKRRVEADGHQFLVSYIPYSDEVNPDWWEEILSRSPSLRSVTWDFTQPARRLAGFCVRNGVSCASPREPFSRRQGDERFYFKNGHFNEIGHAAYARYLASAIERRALSGGGGEPPAR